VLALPAPRDLLARAAWVEAWACDAWVAHLVRTDPRALPDLGYQERPFVVDLVGDERQFTHLDGLDVDGFVVEGPDGAVDFTGCAMETLWASPEVFLEDYLPSASASRGAR
jgi:hypothetical protein